jgi:hypothetical protein
MREEGRALGLRGEAVGCFEISVKLQQLREERQDECEGAGMESQLG